MSRALGHDTKEWRKEARQWLRDHPLCWCGEKAVLVNHLDGDGPVGGGPLQSECAKHHARFHAEERKRSRGVRPG